MARRKPQRGRSPQRSFGTYAVLGFFILLFGVLAYGIYSKNRGSAPPESIRLTLTQERLYAEVTQEFKCTCGACDLVLNDCTCPSAIQTKKDLRKRIQEGAAKEDIEWYLEQVYRAQRVTS